MKKVLSMFVVLCMSTMMWGATSSVPDKAPDVMLQAFYWDSYPSNSSNLGYGNTGWSTLINQADELGEYFDLVWLPPCSQSSGGTGYIPKQYSNLNSDWGSESQLRELIAKLKAKNTRAVADIVVNHITGNYGWCSFATMDFGSYGKFNPQASWICKTDEMNYDSGAGSCKGSATGANDDGYGDEANYTAARDWDHTNPQVQAMCRAYLKWLKNDVGFDGWRYDYGKGFNHSHINDYNSAADAYMSVVEYWDGNPDVIRQRLQDASWNNMAFDFGTKYDALNNGICSFNYAKCKGAGMLGAGYSKHAVTFVDNHDTFQRNSSEFGGQGNSMLSNMKDRLLQANAYILAMPGIPCVFYPHWVTYKAEIKKMIEARHLVGVHSQSGVEYESAEQGGYQATIVGTKGYLILQLGNKVGGSFDGFTKYASGNGYAMWISSSAIPADPNAPKFYVTGNDKLLGESKAWNPQAIAVKETSYTFENLAAGNDYKLKITTDGTWNTAKGYSALTAKAEGLSADDDDNICFSLSEAGNVKVTYTGSVFTLEGKFATSGSGSGEQPGQPVDSVTVYFVNTISWTKVNGFVWPAEGNAPKAWPGEAMKKESEKLQGFDVYSYKFPKSCINIIFNDGTTQTIDLKWNTDKPYFVPSDKNDAGKYQGTWYAKSEVPSSEDPGQGGDPQPTAKFYITGNDELVGESKAWNPDAIAVTEDSYTFKNLAADKDYKMKLTLDGTWSTDKGYNDLTAKADGLSADASGNICFSLSVAGDVKVTYTSTVFKVEGEFATSGSGSGDEPGQTEVTDTLQLVPGVWAKDGAKIAAWTWSTEFDGKWTEFFVPKADKKDTLKAAIPAKADSILFVRFKADATKPNWNGGDGYIWNRIDNDTIDHRGLIYTIIDWSKGQWTEFTPPTDEPGSGDEPGQGGEQEEELETLQLVPGVWTTDDAKIAAWTWSTEFDGKWTAFFAPKAKDNDTLKAEIRAKADSILFVRFNAEVAEPTWDKESSNVWTKLANDTIDHKGLTYTITGWNSGQWTKFTPASDDQGQGDDPGQTVETVTVYFVNNVNWDAVNAYVWDKDGNAYKDWPGEAATKVTAQAGAAKRMAKKLQDVDVYSYTFPKTYINIAFCSGTTQTVDLQWDADKPYFVPTGKDGNQVKGKWCTEQDAAADEPADMPEDGYYLLGTINEWTPATAYLFTVNPGNANEYVLNVTLAAGDKFKVAKVVGGEAKTWYPDGMDNDYVVDANHVGAKTIYFQTTYNAEWEAFGGYFYIEPNTATDIDAVATAEQATKLLRDGRLFIIRGAHIYTVQGQLVR